MRDKFAGPEASGDDYDAADLEATRDRYDAYRDRLAAAADRKAAKRDRELAAERESAAAAERTGELGEDRQIGVAPDPLDSPDAQR